MIGDDHDCKRDADHDYLLDLMPFYVNLSIVKVEGNVVSGHIAEVEVVQPSCM